MSGIKTIGVLTSGGDCAALNAVIRAVTYHAVEGYRWKVLGIQDGTLGLLERPPRYTELDVNAVDGRLLREAGTLLGTTVWRRTHSTACSLRRRVTTPRHDPRSDGRDAGHIALNGGLAGGADIILIPEIPYTLDGIMRRIEQVLSERRSHVVIVVAEGVKTHDGKKALTTDPHGRVRYGGLGECLAQRIAPHTRAEVRVTVLGHLQRGGAPSPPDRILASTFGVHAVDMVAQRRFSRMAAWHNGAVTDVPLSAVTIGSRCVDPNGPLVRTARSLGAYVGEELKVGPATRPAASAAR